MDSITRYPLAEKSDLRYHGKPNVAENVLEDQITRAVQHAWELIKRPWEAMEHGTTTEEAIPWATETAMSTIGTGTKFPATTPGMAVAGGTKVSLKKASSQNVYDLFPEGVTDTSYGTTKSSVTKHGDYVMSSNADTGTFLFHKGEYFGSVNPKNNVLKIGDVEYGKFDTPEKAFEMFKDEVKTAKEYYNKAGKPLTNPSKFFKNIEFESTPIPHNSNVQMKIDASGNPVPKKTLNKDMLNALDYEHLPDWTTWTPSKEALEHGFNVATHHGTNVNVVFDRFALPKDELGVHFGTPRQAVDIQGTFVKKVAENIAPEEVAYFHMKPRVYPTVIQANNPLRLPDLGTWTARKVGEELFKTGEFESSVLGQDISQLRNTIRSKGYDSIVYENKVEGPGYDSYIKFDESPDNPGFATGIRSPWAKFDPGELAKAGLTLGIPAVAATGSMQFKKVEGNPFEDVQ